MVCFFFRREDVASDLEEERQEDLDDVDVRFRIKRCLQHRHDDGLDESVSG